MIPFDLRQVPFSRGGSFLVFSHLSATSDHSDGLFFRTVHGGTALWAIFRLDVLANGQPVPFAEVATPAVLRLETGEAVVELCIAEPHVVRVRGTGAGLRLALQHRHGETVFRGEGSQWHVNAAASHGQYLITPLVGQIRAAASWNGVESHAVSFDFTPDPATATFECAIEEYTTVWHKRGYHAPFDACVRKIEVEFQDWLAHTLLLPEPLTEARALAAYVNWSSVVPPEGHLKRPAMYMSKNWMTNVWSWDHCFNALALIDGQPELAWDQFMIMADHQHESGAYPDSVNDRRLMWNFCKPPVHGWTLRQLMRRPFVDDTRLREAYEPLCRWTDWWFDYRDDNHNGLPQYNHGNDSGWDNATVFAPGMPMETPDLAAFLILQMDVLAEVAWRLGKTAEAQRWKHRADELLQRMLAYFWTEDHFVGRYRESPIESECLLLFLPLVLGERLPSSILAALLAGLKQPGRFITAHGFATESPASPRYEPDGYWRGPIWAPSTLLLIDGLKRVGEPELARDMSRRFCDMAARSGMAENFDALTGAGLRDRAYTWTSSVFLILGHDLLAES
ncbi:MAG TPA: trehalase family glycosidase [Aggregatilineaceae bacterium]|nr:trehalase family glycosidase [Aggregatilineaceae bacterium]